jgi:hypothetical protein
MLHNLLMCFPLRLETPAPVGEKFSKVFTKEGNVIWSSWDEHLAMTLKNSDIPSYQPLIMYM